MNETLKIILFFLSATAAAVFSGLMLNKVMKKQKFKFNPYITLAITVGFTLLEVFLFGISPRVFKGLILLLILLYASCQDITSREVSDILPVMILIVAFSDFVFERSLSMLLGGLAVFVPQMLIVMFTKNKAIRLGGADIKVSTAAAILLGFFPAAIGFMFGLILSIFCQLIRIKTKKLKKTDAFPLIPYLSVGLMIGYLL